ncbi:hypothetical protein NIES2119_03765 [[Phormidium ambiguum] IAM M-71]|uniref:DUF1877 domain-containing protein n=1 Tax=[Phormidium ambiguum] IAM M-71 TaxID=454136 RepID=A0A1U7IRQ3_9CYAN|nr:YfbM family protein [Phormidium ambiguum]OKH40075.1 hypothetical protein NIES2119_03765 [Phormidium ambiguum IAM M-71]
MGIEASYWRVTPKQFAEFQSNPETAPSFFTFINLNELDFSKPQEIVARLQERKNSGSYLSLGKDWQALHFLLTEELAFVGKSQVQPPLCNVVMGGTPTNFEATYGVIRYLTPDEVKEVAEALSQISVNDLQQRFDSSAFNAAEIYPNPQTGGWDEEEIEVLFEVYPKLVEFFKQSAKEGDIILISFD